MGQRILVVDDDEVICDLVREALSFEGFEVEAAFSGERALEALLRIPADLVLLDVMMAGIDGFEVWRRMRADSRLCAIPVIFLTAKGQVDGAARGRQDEALLSITKPFHPLSLAPLIRWTLQSAREHAVSARHTCPDRQGGLQYAGHRRASGDEDGARQSME